MLKEMVLNTSISHYMVFSTSQQAHMHELRTEAEFTIETGTSLNHSINDQTAF